MQASRALMLGTILAGVSAACLKLPIGGPSQDGSGGASSTGGSGSGGLPDSDVPVCAELFDDACEVQPSYGYYLQLCENEDSSTVVDILECVVPSCRSPVDEGTEGCIQLAVEDAQNAYVAALMYDVESICGSQLDVPQVRVVGIHAASINNVDRLEALNECLSQSYCSEIVDCLTDPEVAPWWED